MKDISPTKPESLLEDGRMGCHAVTQCLNTSRDEDDTELGQLMAERTQGTMYINRI